MRGIQSRIPLLTDPARDSVLMRDPIMRAYSEWSMFCLHWHWDHIQQLDVRFRAKMKFFIQCNATLYGDPSLIRKLPDDELFRQCGYTYYGYAFYGPLQVPP